MGFCYIVGFVTVQLKISIVSGKDTVSIGDVSIKIKTAKSPELVPKNYCKYI